MKINNKILVPCNHVNNIVFICDTFFMMYVIHEVFLSYPIHTVEKIDL